MRFHAAWQRLVRNRWTNPARQHAEKMRREAYNVQQTFGPRAGTADALFQGAAFLERLAEVLDDLAATDAEIELEELGPETSSVRPPSDPT